jgi:hypothetical protein
MNILLSAHLAGKISKTLRYLVKKEVESHFCTVTHDVLNFENTHEDFEEFTRQSIREEKKHRTNQKQAD